MFRSAILLLSFISFNANAGIGLFKKAADLPDPATFDTWTCNQLYEEAIKYEVQSQRYHHPILNKDMDKLVSISSTVFQPTLVYYGYTVPRYFWEENRMHKASLILDNIRYRMSALRCFEK